MPIDHKQMENARPSQEAIVDDVALRKDREKAILYWQGFLQSIIDAIPDPVLVIGRDYDVFLANPAARKMGMGIDPTACLACHQFSHHRDEPCEGQDRPCPLRQVIATKAITTATHTHYDATGKAFSVEITAAPVFDQEGEVTHVVESYRDITERKLREERLARLNSLKEQLLGPGNVREKLKLITDGAVEVFGADFARIWVLGEGDLCTMGCRHAAVAEGPDVCRDRSRCLHLLASSGRYSHTNGSHRRVPLGSYKIGRIAAGEEPKFVTNDVTHDPRVHDHQWAERLGLVSFAGYRLLSPRGTPLGVFALFSKRPIDAGDDALLEDLAHTASQVIRTGMAEEALRESEQNFRRYFENAAVGTAQIDATGRFFRVNDRYCHLTGYTREELLGGMGPLDLDHPADREADRKLVERFLRGEDLIYETEKRYLRKDGQVVWVHIASAPIHDQAGRLLYSAGIIQDITARKRAEEALRESEERFRTLAEATPVLIWQCKPDMSCDYFNKAWLDFTGRTIADEVGSGWEAGLHPADQRRCREELASAIERREPFEMEYRLRHHSGDYRWILDRGVPRFAANGALLGYIGGCIDISDRKHAEAELKWAKDSAERAKAAAEEANRVKDHFLAVLSHELRTPLTPVIMGMSMLQDSPNLPPEMRETIEMIRRNAEMEARLIDDLLDVTRIARGKIELHRSAVELPTVIRRAVEVCQPDIEARGLHFGVDLGPASPYWVDVDAARLQQVLWNLLKNAVKFTLRGGCVGLRCRLEGAGVRRQPSEESTSPVGVDVASSAVESRTESAEPRTLNPEPSYVVVEITDSGIGIEPEALSRVFLAFEQTQQSITRQFGGLGLGLAISKTLVELQGGTISAHSEGPNKGATFRVRLPLCSPAGPPEAPMPGAAPQRAARPLHILLVEDHGVTAKIMQMMLTEVGHTVETAGDVATALELAGRHDFDLLLSDLGLPDGSGHDLMRQLRSRGRTLPAIALSGYGQEEDFRRSRDAGFAAHLTKPVSRTTVLDAIASVAAGERIAPKAEAAVSSPPVAPPFDPQAALQRCLDKHDLLDQMIQLFFDDLDKLLPKIRSALERGDLIEVGKLGHRLKGTITHLAAEPAREAALRVEKIGLGGGSQTEAEDAVSILERECQFLRAALVAHQAATVPLLRP